MVGGDGDGVGNVCDADDDNDSILDEEDNCPLQSNDGQEDLDLDELGDICDPDLDGDLAPPREARPVDLR